MMAARLSLPFVPIIAWVIQIGVLPFWILVVRELFVTVAIYYPFFKVF